MSQDSNNSELQQRRTKALAMGGEERLAKRRSQNILNARERLDCLLDKDSFHESGLLAASYRPAVRDKTPADGKITGFGKIDGRPVAVVSNDFTVLGASSSVVNGKKSSMSGRLLMTPDCHSFCLGVRGCAHARSDGRRRSCDSWARSIGIPS